MPYGKLKVDQLQSSTKTINVDDVLTTAAGGITSTQIADGTLVNADINASAAIAHSKLANITAGSVLMGNATNVPTATVLSGDVTIASNGVTSIGAGVIVNADINASAAIDKTKIAGTAITAADTGTVTSTMIADGTLVNADINASAAIAHSKLANITAGQVLLGNASNVPTATALSGDVTVDSSGVTAIGTGVIVNGDINASAAIAGTKISPDFGAQNTTTTGTSTAASFIPTSSTAPTNGVFLPAANTVGISTNSTQRVTVTSTGAVLVGTSSARDNFFNTTGTARLVQVESLGTGTGGISVVRNSNADGGSSIVLAASAGTSLGSNTLVSSTQDLGQISFQGADGTEFVAGASITATVDGTPGANDLPTRLVFSTTADGASSPTERMRIGNAGDVLIGTTSTTVNTTNFGTRIAGSSAPGYFATSSNINGTSGTVADFYGNAGRFLVRGDGDLENTNNSYTGISDAKLKENIVDASSQWDDIKALRVRKYNLKAETGFNTHTQIGLIAQETENICPGLVNTYPDLDEEGNDLGTTTKSVTYSVLYMKAVKALQEAMERIETLEAKVAALEAA